MAQWSRADRTLYAKVVYYGPAFGGKTTNLEALHGITDPQGAQKLLSVKTVDDRTLFFDLLPLDLGEILNHKVALKLYTVPGQVRYDATRQVVLAGADAVVFVADSSPDREEQNRWSLQNLRMNMRIKRLDPQGVPVVFQFNKQDLAQAAPPAEVARWLGIAPDAGSPAVATERRGVLETFMRASRAMLERLVAMADQRTRREIDVANLGRSIDLAFRPYLDRARRAPEPAPEPAPSTPIELHGDDLLQSSIQASIRLGEKLAHETARSTRLERESEALRRLCETLRTMGASFSRQTIIDSALETAAEILDARAVSLVHQPLAGEPLLERAWGRLNDPLLSFEEGRRVLRRMLAAQRSCVVNDLSHEIGEAVASDRLPDVKAAVVVPIDSTRGQSIVAYAPQPDGSFSQQDVRFLATLAGHLSIGLEKVRAHEEIARHRARLEEVVESRTAELSRAYEDLRSLDDMKDRFLTNLSHEMKTPLTAILSSAVLLRDYPTNREQRREMFVSIVHSAEKLQALLENLFRMVGMQSDADPLSWADSSAEALIREATGLVPHERVEWRIEGRPGPLRADQPRLARAVANLIDNALKFSRPDTPVEVVAQPAASHGRPGRSECMRISVLDRGPGIAAEEWKRLVRPFEQGGDPLTGKPGGFGIGLYESSSIAGQHGGTLEMIAREGGGTEFRIEVPFRPAGSAPAAVSPVDRAIGLRG